MNDPFHLESDDDECQDQKVMLEQHYLTQNPTCIKLRQKLKECSERIEEKGGPSVWSETCQEEFFDLSHKIDVLVAKDLFKKLV